MNNKTMLRTGIIGAVLTALCCVTPVLVIGFGAVGLGAWVAGLDYILFPLLMAFAAMAGFWRRHPSQRTVSSLKSSATSFILCVKRAESSGPIWARPNWNLRFPRSHGSICPTTSCWS